MLSLDSGPTYPLSYPWLFLLHGLVHGSFTDLHGLGVLEQLLTYPLTPDLPLPTLGAALALEMAARACLAAASALKGAERTCSGAAGALEMLLYYSLLFNPINYYLLLLLLFTIICYYSSGSLRMEPEPREPNRVRTEPPNRTRQHEPHEPEPHEPEPNGTEQASRTARTGTRRTGTARTAWGIGV